MRRAAGCRPPQNGLFRLQHRLQIRLHSRRGPDGIGLCQGHRHGDGGVGIVALAHIQNSGQGTHSPQVQVIEPLFSARPTRAPVSSSCSFAVLALFPQAPIAPVQPVQLSVCSHWKQNISFIGFSLNYLVFPSVVTVTTCKGISFPELDRAIFTARSRPPQQGTSIRRTVTERMLLVLKIWVSFSA